jgi:hypothetical protein
VKERSKVYCDPWKSAFEWVPEDQPCWYFDLAVWDPSLPAHNWDNKNGRVTLAGDAAHPMTYRRFFLSVLNSADSFRTRSGFESLDHRCWKTGRFPGFGSGPKIGD